MLQDIGWFVGQGVRKFDSTILAGVIANGRIVLTNGLTVGRTFVVAGYMLGLGDDAEQNCGLLDCGLEQLSDPSFRLHLMQSL